jgi:hypothetical protein
MSTETRKESHPGSVLADAARGAVNTARATTSEAVHAAHEAAAPVEAAVREGPVGTGVEQAQNATKTVLTSARAGVRTLMALRWVRLLKRTLPPAIAGGILVEAGHRLASRRSRKE